jgi:hypothetical protein
MIGPMSAFIITGIHRFEDEHGPNVVVDAAD